MAEIPGGRQPPAWRRRFRDATRFARDVLWLVGWGARQLGLAARDNPTPDNVRGCAGCLGSALVLIFAAGLWRRRRK